VHGGRGGQALANVFGQQGEVQLCQLEAEVLTLIFSGG